MNSDFLSGPFQAPTQTSTAPAPKVQAQKPSGLTGLLHNIVSPFVDTGKALAYVPEAIGREIKNKPINDIQQKVFGTTNQGDIAKKIVGNLAQVGATIAPVGKAAEGASFLTRLGQGVKTGAKLGAVGGGGNALANNGNVVQGATEGALTGGAAGGIFNKLLSGGTKAATGISGATDDAIQAARQANGLKSPVASGAAQAKKYGTDLLANKLNVSAKDAEKFAGPQTVAALQKDYGLTVDQAAKLHPVVTGGEGVSTEALDNALEGMGKIKMQDFGPAMKKELEDPDFLSANDLSETQAKNLSDMVDKYHSSLNPDETNTTINKNGDAKIGGSGVNAKAAMDVAKKLEKSGYANQAATSEAKNSTGDLQLKMADFIKSRIYNAPGGGDALNTAKNEAASKLNDIATQSGNTTLSKVAQSYRLAPDFKTFRSISAPFVNAKQLVDKTNLNDFANKGQNSGNGGLFQTLKKAASKVASPAGGKVLSNIGNASEPVGPVASGGILNKLASKPGVPLLTRGTVAEAGTAIPSSGTQPQSTASSLTALPQSVFNPAAASGSTGSSATSGFDKNTLLALVAADPKNADTYISLYKIAGSDLAPTGSTATALKNEQTAENSQSALNQIESSFNAAGGGKGKVSGAVGNLEAKVGLNSNVATYNDTATALAAQIYKALGNTGTISDQDQKLIGNLIPRTTDTTKTADSKIQQLQALLDNAQQIAAQGASQ